MLALATTLYYIPIRLSRSVSLGRWASFTINNPS